MLSRFSKPAAAWILLAVGFIALGYLLSAVVNKSFQEPATPMAGVMNTVATVLSEPIDVPAFTLHDQYVQLFTGEGLKGNWTFLFFGYTHCPDICPTTLVTLDQADRLLRKQAMDPLPKVVFVSVDPQRDTAEDLAAYVAYYNRDFTAVTGTVDQLLALTRPLGIMFQRDPDTNNGDNYLINHSVVVLLIDPEARLRAVFSPPHDPETIAHDYQKIITEFRGHNI